MPSIEATGAAKTSTVLTISIANDLDQKAFNEDYCKKELEERMDTDICKRTGCSMTEILR